MLPIILASLAATLLSPTPPPTDIPTSTPASQNEIQKIREAVKEKVKEKLNEITKSQPLKKGIVGTVSAIADGQLTLGNQGGDTRRVTVTTDTVYIDAKRNKGSLDKIKTGQEILCLGYLQPNGDFDTKRVIAITPATLIRTDRLVIGKIADFSQSASVILLIPARDKDLQYQIKLDDKTELLDRRNQKLDPAADLKPGLLVAAIISPDPKNSKSFIANKIINLAPAAPN